MKIILASASPRRRELMTLAGIPFEAHPVDADETIICCTPPEGAVMMLATRKAQLAAEQFPDDLIIGADTVVAAGKHIYGKPATKEEAFETLSALSGKTHQVFTGVCIYTKSGERNAFCTRTDTLASFLCLRTKYGHILPPESLWTRPALTVFREWALCLWKRSMVITTMWSACPSANLYVSLKALKRRSAYPKNKAPYSPLKSEASTILAIIKAAPKIPLSVRRSPSKKNEKMAVKIGSEHRASDTKTADKCLSATF